MLVLREVERRLAIADCGRWPRLEIVIRADIHYAASEVIDPCRAAGVDFILGLNTSPAPRARVNGPEAGSAARRTGGANLRRFDELFFDTARSWRRVERIVAPVRPGRRASTLADQMRLIVHAGAYRLCGLRAGTPLRSAFRIAQFDRLRLRLLKIAARIVEIKTKVKVHLPCACPVQSVLALIFTRTTGYSPECRGIVPRPKPVRPTSSSTDAPRL